MRFVTEVIDMIFATSQICLNLEFLNLFFSLFFNLFFNSFFILSFFLFFRVHYVNRNQDSDTNCTGNNNSKDVENTKKKDFGTPTKINSFLEFQTVVSATSTSSSTTLSAATTTTDTKNEQEDRNESEIQMKRKSDKKDDHGSLEISFHIKEAWNIFEVRTCYC